MRARLRGQGDICIFLIVVEVSSRSYQGERIILWGQLWHWRRMHLRQGNNRLTSRQHGPHLSQWHVAAIHTCFTRKPPQVLKSEAPGAHIVAVVRPQGNLTGPSIMCAVHINGTGGTPHRLMSTCQSAEKADATGLQTIEAYHWGGRERVRCLHQPRPAPTDNKDTVYWREGACTLPIPGEVQDRVHQTTFRVSKH